ncbi:MAG: DUF2180 family protein [Actinomycetota bacterium]
MNCFVCATQNKTTVAIAVCRQCFVGLCMSHLAESRSFSSGGMRYSCPHDLPTAEPGKAMTSSRDM